MPNRFLASIVLALLLLVQGRVRAATIAELEALSAQQPDNLRIQYNLAKAYAQSGVNDRAIELFEGILAKKKAPAVLFELGVLYARTTRFEQAKIAWMNIVTPQEGVPISHPLHTPAMMKLAALLLKTNQPEEALTWWRKILEVDPTNEKVRLYIGLTLYKAGQLMPAAKEWLLLLKSKPSRPVALKSLFYLGQVFVDLKKPDKAIKVFTKLLKADPLNEKAKAALAKLQNNENPDPGPTLEQLRGDGTTIVQQPTQPPDIPPPPIVQAPPEVPVIKSPGDKPPDNVVNPLQAEELFLDGLDQKEKGNYEKALFAFLQALDVDPKFQQVYLQVGEVYLQLARLAPTEAQFKERVTLALQSLEKVGVLAPNTLLAHSAQGKIVAAHKIEKQGFANYHKEIADTAAKEGRDQDAFEEYILLLSNKYLIDDVFLALANKLPKLNQGNRQDLQFFLEDLSSKSATHAFVPYLLGMTYLRAGKPAEAKITLGIFLDKLTKGDPKEPWQDAYKAHATAAGADLTDRYLIGSAFFARQAMGEAEKYLREYVTKSKPDAPFLQDASRKLGQLGRAAPSRESAFEAEKKELLKVVPSAQVLLTDLVERSHADDKILEDLRTFVQAHPQNGLARFALGWVLTVAVGRVSPPTSGQYTKQAEDTFLGLVREKWPDADYHLQLALLAFNWGLEDKGRTHLKVCGDILLTQGRVHSASHARIALEAARRFLSRGKVSPASKLVEQALVYDNESLLYFPVKYELDTATGHTVSALWNLVEWAQLAMANPWHRLIFLSNLGILVSGLLMLTLFGTALALTLKYFDPLHHFFSEYLQSKGIVFSIPLLVVATLLVLPTGFLVVFPLLVWSLLSRAERQTYLLLIGLLLIVPLALPVSFEGNFAKIRMAEEFRSGNLDVARPFFEEQVKQNEYDYVARFMLGQIYLREQRFEPAEQQFARLYDQDNLDVPVLVNMAVVKHKRGDNKKAMALLTQALGRAPADLPSLYDLAALSAHAGDADKAQQYIRWANGVTKKGDLLKRYEQFYSDVPQVVLMDHPIDPSRLTNLFSFFSTANFFAFNAPVIKVVIWLLAGGGLLGWLIFLWQKLDFELGRCLLCQKTVCNHCLRAKDGKSFCSDCAESAPPDKDKLKAAAAGAAGTHKLKRLKQAFAANLFVPGAGLAFADLAPIGAFFQLVFFGFFLIWAQRGGTLISTIYQVPDLPVVNLLLWFALALAMGVYAMAQLAFRQVKDEIQ